MKVWFILLLSAGVNSIDQKEYNRRLKLSFELVKKGVGIIPGVSIIADMTGTVVDYLLETEEVKVDIVGEIQAELRVLSNSLHESIKGVEVEVKMSIVREVESEASMLMQYIDDYVHADSPASKNKTIERFLKKCKDDMSPYDGVLKMRDQMLEVLRTQAEGGLYRKKSRLDKMRCKFYSILNELVILDFFRNLFANESKQERNDQIKKWNRKLAEIERKTDNLFEELLDTNYWSNLDKIIESVLIGHDLEHLQLKADQVINAMNDIHTKDKFCMLVNRYSEDKMLNIFMTDQGLLHRNEKYFINIIKSKTAHNMTPEDFNSFHASAEQMQKNMDDVCPYKDASNFQRTAHGYNFTTITAKSPDPNLIIKCSEGVLYILRSECSIMRDKGLSREKYAIGVFPL